MKAYQKHKKTDQLWLQQIPMHWNMQKTKHLFAERSEKGFPNEPLLVASQNMGVIPKDVYGARTVEATKDLHMLKLVKKSDFVISLRSFQGGIEYAYYQGIISPAYTVMTSKGEIRANYFRFLGKSRLFIELLQMCVTGIREGQNIDYSRLREFRLPVPPKDEQDQIVKFLDYKVSKINKFIKNKKKLIELLNEQKQAVINHAVTKGLNPHVEMKNSGIDWLGEVPKHWEVKPIKQFVSSNDEALTETTSAEFEFNYIDISSVGFGFLKLNPVTLQFQKSPSRARRIVKKGDTIISTVRTYLKSICFINDALDKHIVSTGFSVLRPKANVFPELLSYILASEYFINAIQRNSIGVSYPAISDVKLNSLKVVLPNNLEEQKEIYLYIQSNLIPYENMISKTQKEIDLIQEYKTSLISSVVTGQVDVRDVVVPNFTEEEFNDIDEVIEEVEEE